MNASALPSASPRSARPAGSASPAGSTHPPGSAPATSASPTPSAPPAGTSPTRSPIPEGLVAAIDRAGEIPIGVQLAWALRSCIRDGRVCAAERLPGLRELAEAVGVNANTVRAVYQRLEREGLIESRQGSGTFVAETPAEAGGAPSSVTAVTAIAADAAREALAAGADPREVAAALYVSPPGADRVRDTSAGAEAGALAHRQALRAQIATLERAIGAMEAEHPGVAPPPGEAPRGRGGPALLSAEELELVRSGLVRRLAAVQTAIDERARAGDVAHARMDGEESASKEGGSAHAATPRTGRKGANGPRTTPRPAAAGT